MCCKLGSESANHVFLFFLVSERGRFIASLFWFSCWVTVVPGLFCYGTWQVSLSPQVSFYICFLSLLSHIFFTFSHFQIVFVLPPPLVSELLYSVYRQTTAAIFFLCVERYLTNINLISFKCLFYPFYSIIYVQPLSFHIIINVYLFL